MRFTYETRHDPHTVFQGGSSVLMDRRLAAIETYEGTSRISQYRLSYAPQGLPQRTRLTGIERCDGAGDCFPGIDLSWNAAGEGALGTALYSRPRTSGDFAYYRPLAGDFNGDGVSDLAWAYQWTSGLRVYASLATVPADAGQVASIRQRLGADIVIDYARLRIPEQSDHRFRRKNYTAVSEDYDRTRVPPSASRSSWAASRPAGVLSPRCACSTPDAGRATTPPSCVGTWAPFGINQMVFDRTDFPLGDSSIFEFRCTRTHVHDRARIPLVKLISSIVMVCRLQSDSGTLGVHHSDVHRPPPPLPQENQGIEVCRIVFRGLPVVQKIVSVWL